MKSASIKIADLLLADVASHNSKALCRHHRRLTLRAKFFYHNPLYQIKLRR